VPAVELGGLKIEVQHLSGRVLGWDRVTGS
jgi:hypothetical protein